MDGADGGGTQLVAQGFDVGVDGAGAGGVHPVPDFLEQLLAGQDGAGAAGQGGQQVELRGRQVHFLALEGDDALRRVDDEGSEVEDLLVLGVLGDGLGAVHAAEQGFAAGDELAHGERLGHVVVGADAEADDFVRFVVAGGEDEHRHRAFGDDAFGGLQAVHHRQHDVHDDQVRTQLASRRDGVSTIPGDAGAPSFGGEALRDGSGERRFVLDDEDGAKLFLQGWFTRVGKHRNPNSFFRKRY